MSTPKEVARKIAQKIWAEMDDNQKVGVRFGLFPAEVMSKYESDFRGPELAVALMQVAKEDGGMRA